MPRRKSLTNVRIGAMVIVALIVIGLVYWTLSSPPPLGEASEGELSTGLFSYSKSTAEYIIKDGSGSYAFHFGLEYNSNLTSGEPTQLAVYAVLTSQNITSGFTRGVAISLSSSNLIVDGRVDSSFQVISRIEPNLVTFLFQSSSLQISPGVRNLTAHLVVSLIDVNYVGSTQGALQPVNLNGTLDIA